MLYVDDRLVSITYYNTVVAAIGYVRLDDDLYEGHAPVHHRSRATPTAERGGRAEVNRHRPSDFAHAASARMLPSQSWAFQKTPRRSNQIARNAGRTEQGRAAQPGSATVTPARSIKSCAGADFDPANTMHWEPTDAPFDNTARRSPPSRHDSSQVVASESGGTTSSRCVQFCSTGLADKRALARTVHGAGEIPSQHHSLTPSKPMMSIAGTLSGDARCRRCNLSKRCASSEHHLSSHFQIVPLPPGRPRCTS